MDGAMERPFVEKDGVEIEQLVEFDPGEDNFLLPEGRKRPGGQWRDELERRLWREF